MICYRVDQSPSVGITVGLFFPHSSYQTNIASGKYLLYATSGVQNCVKLCTKESSPCYINFSWDCWSGTSWERPNPPVGSPDAHGAFTLHSSSVLSEVLERSGVCGHDPEDDPNRIHTFTLGGKIKQGPLGLPVRHLYVCKQDVGGWKASPGGQPGGVGWGGGRGG